MSREVITSSIIIGYLLLSKKASDLTTDRELTNTRLSVVRLLSKASENLLSSLGSRPTSGC